jgi:hypothetical protein
LSLDREKLRKNRKQSPPAGETACPTIAAQAFAKKKVGQAVSPAYLFAASEGADTQVVLALRLVTTS